MNMNIDELIGEDESIFPPPPDHVFTSDDLVPGPSKPLRVGYDDILIQHYAQDNALKLEDEKDKDKIKRFYVVSLECSVVPLTLTNEHVPRMEFHPASVIIADCMRIAIKQIEQEYGKRLWLPLNESNRFERQLGIPRIIADRAVKRVTIHRIRKDCVFGELRIV